MNHEVAIKDCFEPDTDARIQEWYDTGNQPIPLNAANMHSLFQISKTYLIHFVGV